MIEIHQWLLAVDNQEARRGVMRQRKQQLPLGDVIKVVSQVAHGGHEMILVVADLINRGGW